MAKNKAKRVRKERKIPLKKLIRRTRKKRKKRHQPKRKTQECLLRLCTVNVSIVFN